MHIHRVGLMPSFLAWAVAAIMVLPHSASGQVVARAGYVGTVTQADAHEAGELFTFSNLTSDAPVVSWPSGYAEPYVNVFENDDIIVLFRVARFTGSTETIYLLKKRMSFTIIEVGVLQATVQKTDLHPQVTRGTLKW